VVVLGLGLFVHEAIEHSEVIGQLLTRRFDRRELARKLISPRFKPLGFAFHSFALGYRR
jgi:hypothetical protein